MKMEETMLCCHTVYKERQSSQQLKRYINYWCHQLKNRNIFEQLNKTFFSYSSQRLMSVNLRLFLQAAVRLYNRHWSQSTTLSKFWVCTICIYAIQPFMCNPVTLHILCLYCIYFLYSLYFLVLILHAHLLHLSFTDVSSISNISVAAVVRQISPVGGLIEDYLILSGLSSQMTLGVPALTCWVYLFIALWKLIWVVTGPLHRFTFKLEYFH